MTPEQVKRQMLENIHFSKTLKRLEPALYNLIMQGYPGSQPKEKIWNFCHGSTTVPLCECGGPVKFSNQFKTGYNRFCSAKCAQNSQQTREGFKRTMLDRYGVTNNLALQSVKEQKKRTWLKTLGVDNPAKSAAVKEKIARTTEDRYGEGWRQDAFRRNMLNTHGVENWAQVPEFYQKFSEKQSNKKYSLPSGRSVHVQGYEHWALDTLFQRHSEQDLKIHTGVPTVFYLVNGRRKVHYPDIFIVPTNTLVEVKSGYTFRSMLDRNILKGRAALEQGFNYQFWVFDRQQNLQIIDALAL